MSCDTAPCNGRRDLVAGWSAFYLWIIPSALILVGAFVPDARTFFWSPSFALMGLSCLVNARRCGRLHCHATGPLFLAAALASALDAFGVPLLPWKTVLVLVVVGTALAFICEWVRGKYIATPVS
jgi:hypothetical protein